MEDVRKIYAELLKKPNRELQKMIPDREHICPSLATAVLINRLLDRVYQLEKEVLLLSGQNGQKRKTYYYCDVELTDELLVEYIDSEAFTIYELEKIVGAKRTYCADVISALKSGFRHRNAKMISNSFMYLIVVDKICI